MYSTYRTVNQKGHSNMSSSVARVSRAGQRRRHRKVVKPNHRTSTCGTDRTETITYYQPPQIPDDYSMSSTGMLVDEIRHELSSQTGQQVAETLWGYVLMRGYDASVFAAVASVVCESMDKFDIAALTAVLSAQAHTGHHDRALVVAAAQKLSQPYALAELDASSVSQLMWSMGSLSSQGVVKCDQEEPVQELVAALVRQASRKVSDMTPDDMARFLSGLAETHCHVPKESLFDQVNTRLRSTIIPLSQISLGGLAQVLWAMARLSYYDRDLYDMILAKLSGNADDLDFQACSHVAWVLSSVRDQDFKHRAVHDVNVLHAIGGRATAIIEQAMKSATSNAPSSLNKESATATINQMGSNGATTHIENGNGNGNGTGSDHFDAEKIAADLIKAATTSVPASTNAVPVEVVSDAKSSTPKGDDAVSEVKGQLLPDMMTLLLAYSNLSHSDTDLLKSAAQYLIKHISAFTAQDLVVTCYVYGRMKYKFQALTDAVATALPKCLGDLDGDDLVYVASLGPSTNTFSDGLMHAVIDQALLLASEREIGPVQLLDLARCVVPIVHHDPAYYEDAQHMLLQAVHDAQVSEDIDDMSTHCGATDPLGLQK